MTARPVLSIDTSFDPDSVWFASGRTQLYGRMGEQFSIVAFGRASAERRRILRQIARADGGGNPFRDYQLPEAVLKLKQGFGRLIRTRRDTGRVVILDPRVRTKPYGRTFLDSLPNCRRSEIAHIPPPSKGGARGGISDR